MLAGTAIQTARVGPVAQRSAGPVVVVAGRIQEKNATHFNRSRPKKVSDGGRYRWGGRSVLGAPVDGEGAAVGAKAVVTLFRFSPSLDELATEATTTNTYVVAISRHGGARRV